MDSQEHHAHVLPLKVYFGVWGALMVGTILTVAASFVHIGPFNVPLMLLIAVTKATLVALFFMHLLYDEKFNLVVFLAGLLFVGFFFVGTMADTETRGEIHPEERHFIQPEMPRGAAAGAMLTTATATATEGTTSTDSAPTESTNH